MMGDGVEDEYSDPIQLVVIIISFAIGRESCMALVYLDLHLASAQCLVIQVVAGARNRRDNDNINYYYM